MAIKLEDGRLHGLHPPEDLLYQLERIADTLNVRLKWRVDDEGNMMAGIKTSRGEFWTHLSNYDLYPWHSAFARLGLLDKTEEDYTDYKDHKKFGTYSTYPVVNPKLPRTPYMKFSPQPAIHHVDPKNPHQALCRKWNMPPN